MLKRCFHYLLLTFKILLAKAHLTIGIMNCFILSVRLYSVGRDFDFLNFMARPRNGLAHG